MDETSDIFTRQLINFLYSNLKIIQIFRQYMLLNALKLQKILNISPNFQNTYPLWCFFGVLVFLVINKKKVKTARPLREFYTLV